MEQQSDKIFKNVHQRVHLTAEFTLRSGQVNFPLRYYCGAQFDGKTHILVMIELAMAEYMLLCQGLEVLMAL